MTWIFGYGSLIWRPDFPHEERRPARLRGMVRRFWQASPDHRGTPQAPGRVVTLAPEANGEVWGMAYRIAPKSAASIFPDLDHREKAGYELLEVALEFADRSLGARAVTYVGHAGNDSYVGHETALAIAEVIARSHGPSGSNVEYLFCLAQALRVMGVDDEHVFELEALVRQLQLKVPPERD